MKKIIIVEDGKDILTVYRELLPGDQFEVISAADTISALRLIKSRNPDLIILDLIIPGPGKRINGFDLLKQIRTITRFNNTPVLVVTNLDDMRDQAISLGANDYLEKANTSLEVFLRKIRRYTGVTSN